jgi:hypothetical protein
MKNVYTGPRMKRILLMTIIFMTTVILETASHAWLYYHKPAFKGQVLDAETRQPLEGVAVEVLYKMRTFGLGPESGTETFDVREAATDKNGMFYVPSYTTITRPNAISSFVVIIFYKPGYSADYRFGNFDTHVSMTGDDQERFFSEDFGKEQDLLVNPNQGKVGANTEWHKIVFGIIRLPRLKTREERWKAVGSPIYPELRHKTPVINKLEAEEEKHLGIVR